MKFLNVLTIVFIVLKLTGYIDWNWALVLLPTLIVLGVFVAGVLFIAFESEESRQLRAAEKFLRSKGRR